MKYTSCSRSGMRRRRHRGGKVKALGQEDSVEGFAVTQAALDVAEGDVSVHSA